MSFRHTLYMGATFRALYIVLVFRSTIALIKGYDLFFNNLSSLLEFESHSLVQFYHRKF